MLLPAHRSPLQKPLRGAGLLPTNQYLALYQQAVALYSLRKITPQATKAIRIRRDSDNVEQDIAFVGKDLDEQSIKDFGGYNLLGYTENFSQGWQNVGSVIVSSSTEKTANNTANTFNFEDNSTSSPSLMLQSTLNTANTTYNASIYIKNVNTSNNQSTFNCYGNGNSETNIIIDWSTNTATFITAGLNGRNLLFVQQADGFFRLSFDFDVTTSNNAVLYRFWSTNRSNPLQTGTIRAGGFQLTQGVGVKPYQPRTAGGASDCFIVKWYDQVGNNDSVQNNVALQPKIYDVLSGEVTKENGKSAIVFDGVDDNLEIPSVAGQSNIDAYFVNRHDDTSTTSIAPNLYLYFNSNNSRFGFVGQKNNTGSLYGNYGTPSLYKNNTLFTGSNRDEVYDFLGQSQNIVNHQGANISDWSNCYFGKYTASNSWNFEGSLQEIIIFADNLTTAERQILHDDINNYYGIY